MQIENNKNLITGLTAFGLNKKEAMIYIIGLYVGSTTVIEISRHAKLPRTTVYSILEPLVREGIFQVGKRKKQTVYTAQSPQILEQLFQQKQISFHGIAHELNNLYQLNFRKTHATIYEGTDGFKQLWRDIFHSGITDYRLISSGRGMLEYVHEPHLVKHIIANRVKLGIKSRQIIAECREAHKIVARDSDELRESRFLPVGTQIPASVIIFADNVAFITTRHENVMISVMSGDIAITYRSMFDLLWQASKVPTTS